MFDLYIGNCDSSINKDILNDYIKKEVEVNIKDCVELRSNNKYNKSFKITINRPDRDKLLSSSIWPEGIICRKYYSKRY